jgi:hypothetical protein
MLLVFYQLSACCRRYDRWKWRFRVPWDRILPWHILKSHFDFDFDVFVEQRFSSNGAFVERHFHRTAFSSNANFLEWHFCRTTFTSNDVFIRQHFCRTTFSSNDVFRRTTFSSNDIFRWTTFSSNDILRDGREQLSDFWQCKFLD